ncbi:MAG: YIEGIA domain-containing protein, partial [Bacillota bacterium]
YIEGIARVFEARNYLAMLVALLVSTVLTLTRPPAGGALLITAAMAGAALVTIGRSAWGPKVGDIASVRPARIEFDGPLLTVEGAVLLNVGRSQAREVYLRQAFAAVIEPKDEAAAATLASPGQRQAIVHDVVSRVGVFMDVDEPEFAPVARRHVQKDAVIVVILPQVASFDEIASAIRNAPVLEASIRLTGYRERPDGVLPRSLRDRGGRPGGG